LVKTEAALAAQLDAQADEARRNESAGDWVNALALWSRIRATAGTSAAAEAGISRCRSALHRKTTARAAFAARTASKTPGSSSVSQDAVAAYANGDLTRAVALLRDVAKNDPSNDAAARLLAKAERQLRPLTSEERAHVRELYLRGMSFFTANEFEKAIA